MCRLKTDTPQRSDFVEVSWLLDSVPKFPKSWCRAEVLHIQRSPVTDVLGKGFVLYRENEHWDSELHGVDLVPNHLLHCTEEAEEDSVDEDEQSSNGLMSWQCVNNSQTLSNSASSDADWASPEQPLNENAQK